MQFLMCMNLSLLFEVLSQLFHQHFFRLIYNHVFLLCFFHSVFLEVLLSEMTAFQPRLTFVSHLLPFAHLPFHLPKHVSPFFIHPHPLLYLLPDFWVLRNCGYDNRKIFMLNQAGASLYLDLFIHASTNKTDQSKQTLCALGQDTHTLVNPYAPL